MKHFCFCITVAIHLAVGVFDANRAEAANWTQSSPGAFSWNDAANWNPTSPPNSINATATFTSGGGPATQSVSLDAAVTLGFLDVSNSSTSYTISNGTGGSLFFDTGSATTATLELFITGGVAQTIAANMAVSTNGLTVNNNSSTALTLSGPINTAGQLTFNAGGSGPEFVTNVISGAGFVAKRGSGSLTFSAANTYSGGTYFGAPGQVGSNLNLGKIILSDGNNRLPTTGVVNFHPLGYIVGQNFTSVLDIGSTSQTISTMHLPGAGVVGGSAGVTTEQPTGAQVTISGSGGTLTLNGDNFYVGVAVQTANTNPGPLAHNVNMTNLSNFVFDNPDKEIGVHDSGVRVNAATSLVGTLTLAPNTTIKAANLLVGDRGPEGANGGGRSVLNFGSGNTVLNIGSNASTGQFNIGYSKRSNADVTLAAGGNLTIRGFGGGSTPLPEWFVGLVQNSVSGSFANDVNFSAGTVNAIVTSMLVGVADTANVGNRAGGIKSNFTLGATSGAEGFTVGTLTVGRIAGTVTDSAHPLAGLFSANGVFTMNNAAGTLNATTINLAENTIQDPGTQPKTVAGTLEPTSGTIKANTIQLGAQTGNATIVTPKLNWANGIIENPTGGNTAINKVPIALSAGTHTFNATGSSTITLDSNSVISGGGSGVVKNGTGTVVFNAANTYSDVTAVNGGLLIVNASHLGGGGYSVAVAGTLGGAGPISATAVVDSGGHIAPGDLNAVGKLTLGGLTTSGGIYTWQLGALKDQATGTAGTDFDQIAVSGDLAISGNLNIALDFGLLTPAGQQPGAGNAFWSSNHSWKIIDTTTSSISPSGASITGTGSGIWGITIGSDAEAGDIFLNYTVGTSLAGDVNGDHVVNQLDLNVIFGNWLSTGASLAQGDANGDHVINQLDINAITSNWLATGPASGVSATAVPEPGGFCLLTLGIVGLFRPRRSRIQPTSAIANRS